jgi:predicted aconitase
MTALDRAADGVDLTVIGCPHASLDELSAVAEAVRGQRVRAALWVTTARQVRDEAADRGQVAAIEAAGGLVVADGCVVVAPMSELRYHTIATNSAKLATYALPHAGLNVHFGSLERCVTAALEGRWPAPAEATSG